MNKRKPTLFFFKEIGWFTLFISVFCLIFIYNVPYSIVHSEYFIVRFIQFIAIFFILPINIFITLYFFSKKGRLSIGIAAISILLVGPTSGLYEEHREKLELLKYGTWTKGIVIERKQISEHGGGAWHWGIKCEYVIGGRTYKTLFNDDLKDAYSIGDTVKISYSKRFLRFIL